MRTGSYRWTAIHIAIQSLLEKEGAVNTGHLLPAEALVEVLPPDSEDAVSEQIKGLFLATQI